MTTLPIEKSIYDHVIYDSGVERDFAMGLEAMDEVKLFVKLPDWFVVPTPIGNYNPDWAVVFQVQDEFGEKRDNDPANNVAKNVIDFSITIPRERLRPNYGDDFKGAPLGSGQSSPGPVGQDRGVNRDEPKTAKEVGCAS